MEASGEGGVVFLLFRTEADVFQQHDLARLQGRGHSLGLGAGDVLCQRHRQLEELLQPAGHGLQAQLGVDLALGTAQMGAQDHGSILFQQIADGGQRAADADIIGDLSVVIQRNIEVAANKYFFPGNIDVRNGLLVVIHNNCPRILSLIFLWELTPARSL